MTDPTLEERVERLESHTRRLERQNRRLQALAVVAVAAFAAAVCMGQVVTPKTVEAEEFTVRDASGRRRGAFGMTSGGQPRLTLFDAHGRTRLSFTLRITSREEAGLVLYDEKGTRRAVLAENPVEGGEPGLLLLDAKGDTRAELCVGEHGNASLYLCDSRGRRRVILSWSGQPNLQLHGEGQSGQSMGVFKGGAPYFMQYGDDGRPRMSLGLNNTPHLHLRDPRTAWKRAILALGEDGSPALRLLDARENSLFSAP